MLDGLGSTARVPAVNKNKKCIYIITVYIYIYIFNNYIYIYSRYIIVYIDTIYIHAQMFCNLVGALANLGTSSCRSVRQQGV